MKISRIVVVSSVVLAGGLPAADKKSGAKEMNPAMQEAMAALSTTVRTKRRGQALER